MSDTNGWAGKPGVPLNPEKRQWHWVCGHSPAEKPRPELWSRNVAGFFWWSGMMWREDAAALHWRYLGPCLTPAEVEARVQQTRREALEEAARVVEDCDHPWVEAREAEHEAADLMAGRIAGAIRALSATPPGSSLVPREPTPAMIEAGFLVGPQAFKNRKTADWWPSDVTAIYSAMVKAVGKEEGHE
jgi:hypothetical protein